MKSLPKTALCVLSLAAPLALQAAEAVPAVSNGTWHANSLLAAIGNMLLFALIGILAAIAGYRLFDWLTPGDLHGEILEKKNVAAALVGGAIILGVCIIVAASMLG
jgi:uncharacterized membrane protein YjfL (UPF0719 family)